MNHIKTGSHIDYSISGVVFLRGTVTDIDLNKQTIWVRPDSNPAADPIEVSFDNVKVPLDTVLADIMVPRDLEINITHQDTMSDDDDQEGFEDD